MTSPRSGLMTGEGIHLLLDHSGKARGSGLGRGIPAGEGRGPKRDLTAGQLQKGEDGQVRPRGWSIVLDTSVSEKISWASSFFPAPYFKKFQTHRKVARIMQ